jgi:hypothetical protein
MFVTPAQAGGDVTALTLDAPRRHLGHAKAALGLFAVGWSRVLPGGEFVIERGDLV